MERIFTDEVVEAMRHAGWGEYTQPYPKSHVVASKPPGICHTPNNSLCTSRPNSMQGLTYSDGKKIFGHDLGIEQFSTDVRSAKKISGLCRSDMKDSV